MLSIEPVDRLSRTSTSWPRVEQRLGQMGSDESGSAGDQRSHVVSVLSSEIRRWTRVAATTVATSVVAQAPDRAAATAPRRTPRAATGQSAGSDAASAGWRGIGTG